MVEIFMMNLSKCFNHLILFCNCYDLYSIYIYSLSLYIFTNNVIIPMVVCRLIFMTPVLSTLW